MFCTCISDENWGDNTDSVSYPSIDSSTGPSPLAKYPTGSKSYPPSLGSKLE